MAGTLSRFGRGKRLPPSAIALPLSLLAVAVIFAMLKPAFMSLDTIVGIVHRMATTGIMAEGMTFVIRTGGIDLSVGPVLAIAGLVSFFSLQSGAPVVVAVLAGVGTGAVVGAINGAAVAIFKLPAIIVTLAMLSIVRGSALIVGGPIPPHLRAGKAYSVISTGFIFGRPFPIWPFAGRGGRLGRL